MQMRTVLPNVLALAVLFLLVAIGAQLVLAHLADAKPYPRADHYGLSEDKRQYPHHRRDDYEDYGQSHYRLDDYTNYIQPSLSELDRTPEAEISLERATTMRSRYLFHNTKGFERRGDEGRGFMDRGVRSRQYEPDHDAGTDWSMTD